MTTATISLINFILPVNQSGNFVFNGFMIIIDVFYLTGELISLQSLRCSPGYVGTARGSSLQLRGPLNLNVRAGWVGVRVGRVGS